MPELGFEVVMRKESSTTTFWAGVFDPTRTLTTDNGRLRKQFFKGVKETVAGVAGGEGLRAAAWGILEEEEGGDILSGCLLLVSWYSMY